MLHKKKQSSHIWIQCSAIVAFTVMILACASNKSIIEEGRGTHTGNGGDRAQTEMSDTCGTQITDISYAYEPTVAE